MKIKKYTSEVLIQCNKAVNAWASLSPPEPNMMMCAYIYINILCIYRDISLKELLDQIKFNLDY